MRVAEYLNVLGCPSGLWGLEPRSESTGGTATGLACVGLRRRLISGLAVTLLATVLGTALLAPGAPGAPGTQHLRRFPRCWSWRRAS